MKETDLNTVKFSFEVLDNGVVVDLTGTMVRLTVKKPFGLTVMQDCVVTDAINGLCEIVLTNQAYAEVGTYTGELVITKDVDVTVTRSFEYSSLAAILDDETLQSQNDWQSLHQIMLNSDMRPILGEGSPNTIVSPEYIGQTYLDTIGMVMYFASTVTNDAWLPFGTGGGGGEGGSVYWNDVLLKPTTFTPSTHSHLWTDITDAPTQMAPTAHQHDYATGITNKPTSFPPAAHTHSWTTDITDKPTSFTPSAHSHAITDVTGLETALEAKLEAIPAEYLTQSEGDLRYEPLGGGGGGAPKTGTTDPTGITPDFVGQIYVNTTSKEAFVANSAVGDWQTISMDELGGAGGTITWDAVTEKPTAFTPATHSHAMTDITGLSTALSGKSATGHTHTINDVSELDTALSGKSDTNHTHSYSTLTNIPATFTPAAHAHAMTDITGLSTALTGKSDTGHTHTYSSLTEIPTTFTPAAHTHPSTAITDFNTAVDGRIDTKLTTYDPNVDWGEIGGTLASQTDLTTALNGKSDTGHTHAYTSLTGIPTTFTPATHSHAIADVTDLSTTLNGKSDTGHTHSYTSLTDIPTSFTPATHSHAIADVTDLSTTLNAKQPKPTSVTALPVTAPAFSGEMAVDATNKRVYIAEGTTAGDWKRLAETSYADAGDNYIKETILGNKILWSGTQAAYDALTPDANTLYFITG